ncbi:hypothetical protein KBY75_13000 [Cyanobium sp. T1G-Tous]|uniref:hypothetical protein n=1 Tax=Cyanobium sp. T1G-Tous TaxID=2823722 RepID=UPI0020CF438E|nr:hypothetical protein [Cyanobium sp. T1G-Tous]MCP9804484.1 hypothetical protein [Cyanobium sp. T1G-Tous]
MLNIVAFGPCFFDSIRHLDADAHRCIIRDLENPRLAYTIHSASEGSETFDNIINGLLRVTMNDDLVEPDEVLFSHQTIRLWKNFFDRIYGAPSSTCRLICKDYNDFLLYNSAHSKQIWIHPGDIIEFNVEPGLYSELCFASGRSSDAFHSMLVQQGRFSEAFTDYLAVDELLEKIDIEILHLPSQFYKTIILFDKYLSHTLFKYGFSEADAFPGKPPQDQDLDGFSRFLEHLKYLPNHQISTIVLIGQYPYSRNRLERPNNVEVALSRIKQKTEGLDYLRDLQIEVVFVCPFDFPDVYHDRYCAWSALYMSHHDDFYFMNLLQDCLGNEMVLDCDITHFWMDGGRGFQAYEQIASASGRSYQHITFNFQADIMAMERDLFYRFTSWPHGQHTNGRREWSSLDGHSFEHGFSRTYPITL